MLIGSQFGRSSQLLIRPGKSKDGVYTLGQFLLDLSDEEKFEIDAFAELQADLVCGIPALHFKLAV